MRSVVPGLLKLVFNLITRVSLLISNEKPSNIAGFIVQQNLVYQDGHLNT